MLAAEHVQREADNGYTGTRRHTGVQGGTKKEKDKLEKKNRKTGSDHDTPERGRASATQAAKGGEKEKKRRNTGAYAKGTCRATRVGENKPSTCATGNGSP